MDVVIVFVYRGFSRVQSVKHTIHWMMSKLHDLVRGVLCKSQKPFNLMGLTQYTLYGRELYEIGFEFLSVLANKLSGYCRKYTSQTVGDGCRVNRSDKTASHSSRNHFDLE